MHASVYVRSSVHVNCVIVMHSSHVPHLCHPYHSITCLVHTVLANTTCIFTTVVFDEDLQYVSQGRVTQALYVLVLILEFHGKRRRSSIFTISTTRKAGRCAC